MVQQFSAQGQKVIEYKRVTTQYAVGQPLYQWYSAVTGDVKSFGVAAVICTVIIGPIERASPQSRSAGYLAA